MPRYCDEIDLEGAGVDVALAILDRSWGMIGCSLAVQVGTAGVVVVHKHHRNSERNSGS